MTPAPKDTAETAAWFADVDGRPVFAKHFPPSLDPERAEVEAQISGGGFHAAIVRLRARVECADGQLYLYDRVSGENLGSSEMRHRFERLPFAERAAAVLDVVGALAAICDAGFTVVDWYEGNMIYDFSARRIWLFDWELCRRGSSFVLDMDSNYGSSRLQAPEEFIRGSVIDEQTLVFNLGRYVMLTLPEAAEVLAEVLSKATYPAKAGRTATVREFESEMRISPSLRLA